MYEKILEKVVATAKSSEDVDMEERAKEVLRQTKDDDIKRNITVGNHIMSIIFTIHNTNRQKQRNDKANMVVKTASTSFKVMYKGNEISITTASVQTDWEEVMKQEKLEYKTFEEGDEADWYGTMGPYLDMFSAFALRTNELRLGHNNMPITKVEGVHRSFPVSKYGLSGAHHVLLEGTSFPPERRSSIVQSLGPMTAWLCMLRSEGKYRQKYARAVKRAMAHVPCIDEIIEITKNTKQASEISTLTTLIAEILLITTARQATRMFFPITIFASVWKTQTNKQKFCDFFSTTGAGGWYTYKLASGQGPFYMAGSIEEEMASQIVFHSLFGTYKEDLSILEQITNVKNWYTREKLGSCFRQMGSSSSVTKITLPKMSMYAKMSCANQSSLLSGVYNQVATVPCFSGKRAHLFDAAFFEHIEKKRIIGTMGKTLNQIIATLTSVLEELHEKLRKSSGSMNMGTTTWRDMQTLGLDRPGDEIEVKLVGRNKMFLGREK